MPTEAERLQETVRKLAQRLDDFEEERGQAKLETLGKKVNEVSEVVKAIETRRSAWLRTLVLALAAPVAAGLFGWFNKLSDVEVKKFEQYNQLVDKALDSTKGEAYRLGVLDYIRRLDPEGTTSEMNRWASDQITMLEQRKKLVAEESKSVEKKRSDEQKALDSKRKEVEAAGKRLTEAKASTSGDADAKVLAAAREFDEAARAEAIAVMGVEDATREYNQLQARLGEAPAPEVQPTLVAEQYKDLLSEDAFGSGWIVVLSSDRKLGGEDARSGARAELKRILPHNATAQIVRRRSYYHVVVGPYDLESQAVAALEELQAANFRPEPRPREARKFCHRGTEVGNHVLLCDG